jgi:hypothetical protein
MIFINSPQERPERPGEAASCWADLLREVQPVKTAEADATKITNFTLVKTHEYGPTDYARLHAKCGEPSEAGQEIGAKWREDESSLGRETYKPSDGFTVL